VTLTGWGGTYRLRGLPETLIQAKLSLSIVVGPAMDMPNPQNEYTALCSGFGCVTWCVDRRSYQNTADMKAGPHPGPAHSAYFPSKTAQNTSMLALPRTYAA